jgi:hypothetical protein
MRNFFVLTYDSDDDAAEVVADYEMGGFDLTTFWTGSPFAGTIPDDVALFVRDGHPSDYLANPISWPIVSDRFRELIEQMDPPSTQFLDVPLYRVGTRERVRGYWLANITRCLPVVVPGKGGVKELQVDLLVLAGDRIPPEIQIFRLQAPKLRTAIKSLKLARLEPTLAPTGFVRKKDQPKAPFETAHRKHAAQVEDPSADFDIQHLARQIDEECVWPSSRGNPPDFTKWGDYNESEKSYCVSLLTRIESIVHSPELACVFQPGTRPSLFAEFRAFFENKDDRILRVSLRHVSFAHDAREIVADAIGRHLLDMARTGQFRKRPLLVMLDEAHQFLDKTLGDEQNRFPLESFNLIAKEGRKFSINICIATQRPRDIPEGVLSQMGTLVVHRLINDRDREVVERASGEIDRSAAAFLPTLTPGQAVLIGVDFPMPLVIQVLKPEHEPDSRGPDYQSSWRTPRTPRSSSDGRT